jgi:hypothetical protein
MVICKRPPTSASSKRQERQRFSYGNQKRKNGSEILRLSMFGTVSLPTTKFKRLLLPDLLLLNARRIQACPDLSIRERPENQ